MNQVFKKAHLGPKGLQVQKQVPTCSTNNTYTGLRHEYAKHMLIDRKLCLRLYLVCLKRRYKLACKESLWSLWRAGGIDIMTEDTAWQIFVTFREYKIKII